MRSILAAFLTLLLVSGCSRRSDNSEVGIDSTNLQTPAQAKKKHDFAIVVNSQEVPLQVWENEVDLAGTLGQPRSVTSRVLGEGADTHTGATIKTISYPGLKLEVYAPKDKDTGWVMSMSVTGSMYPTSRGALVRDSVARVKQLYPEGSIFPDGRNDPKRYAWYISDAANYSTLKFEIDADTVRQIDLYYELP